MVINTNYIFHTKYGQGITVSGKNVEICYASNKNCVIESPVRICSNVKIDIGRIGAFSFFNQNSYLRHIESVGRFSLFGSNIMTGGGTHPIESISTHMIFQNMDCGWNQNFHHLYDDLDFLNDIIRYQKCHELKNKTRIIIGNDVWIGNRVTILKGVKIGNGAVIGAGAVVTKDVEAYSVVGGVPAKPIKKRFSERTIELLEKIKWWEYGPDIMCGIDLNNPDEAVKYLEEKIANGQKKYEAEKFEFVPKENLILKTDGKNKKVIYKVL